MRLRHDQLMVFSSSRVHILPSGATSVVSLINFLWDRLCISKYVKLAKSCREQRTVPQRARILEM